MRGRAELSRSLLALAIASGFAMGAACAGPSRARPAPVSVPAASASATQRAAENGATAANGALQPEFVPAFETLQAALDAYDDRAARQILNRIFLRRPRGAALDLARRFDRVIAGRECAKALDLALDCRAPADAASDAPWQLVLVATSKLPQPVRLRPGPATVSIWRASVDSRGSEDRGFEARSLGQLAAIEVPARGTREVALFEFRMPSASAALCLRTTFELDLRSGVFERDGRELPAQSVRVRRGEARILAPALAERGPAKVEELVALASSSRVPGARALDLALRLSPEQRGAALDALTPLVQRMAEADVRELVPTLRWLGETAEPGGDPDAWRSWLSQRSRAREPAPSRLSLPPPEHTTDERVLAVPDAVRQDGSSPQREHR